MTFQIKDFVSIVAGMLNHLRGTEIAATDFRQGGVVRSMVEAPAVEIDELYQQMFIGLREAIPVSVYTTFDFEKLPAKYASGLVTLTADPVSSFDIVIPLHTIVRVPGTKTNYLTQAVALIPAGSAGVNVTVVASVIGAAGNAAALAVTELVGTIVGVTAVSNSSGFFDGRDVESDDDRKTRFRDYISTLSKGTNTAIIYGAKTATIIDGAGLITESVHHASMVEPYLLDNTQPPSVISCRIHNGGGGTSPELVAATQAIVDGYQQVDGTIVQGWKAAGVICTVLAATEILVTITGAITVLKNYDGILVRNEALTAVNNYVQALPVGVEVVLSEIVAVIMAVEGVYNVLLAAPLADVTVPAISKAMPSGASTLTWTMLP